MVTPSPNSSSVDLRVSSDHAEGWRIQSSDAGAKGIARTIRVGTFGYTREVSGNAVPPVLLRPAKFRRGLDVAVGLQGRRDRLPPRVGGGRPRQP